jgi:hypothetical protein
MVVDYVVKKNPNVASVATDANVCRRCHRDLEKKVIAASTGVRMSHKETAAAALPCTTCHVSVGHTRRAFTGSMSECITCHDGRTASTECTSCHVRDPGAVFLVGEESTSTIGSGRVIYPAVRAANRNCGGCHDVVRNCDPCHGMRMPHSLEFKKSGHARAAAWGRKKMCAKCHTQADCGSPCHGTMDITTGEDGHAPNWEAEHRTAGWDAGCACHASRGTPRGTKPICTLCHDEKTHKLLPIPN